MRTLSNAVEQGKVHHAYLFVGSRGTGKTSMAKILAACMNCVNGPTISPCGTCDSCVAIANATSLDVIEMDAASNNSVDDIRDLREKVAYAPVSGRHKVYILDEAHMLSSQAWNAFLKTLEEPPPRTIFVLATTEAQKVLPTVVDRCHRFDFGRPSVEQVAKVLARVVEQEGIDIDQSAIALVARHATGSFRDALGTLEQLVTYAGGKRIEPADVLAVLGIADAEQLFAAVDAIIAANPAAALRAANTLAESGRDPGQVLRDLEVHGRELLTVQVLGDVPDGATGHRRPGPPPRRAGQGAAQDRRGAPARPRLASARRDRQRRAAANPARAGADQGVGARGRSVHGRIAGADRAPGRGVALRSRARTASPRRRPAPPAAPRALTPEPEPEPARPPSEAAPQASAAITAALSLDAAVSSWPAVLDLVKGENSMLATALAAARPVAVGERELTLAFPGGASFLKRKAEQDEHRRVAAEALKTVTGHRVALRYELREDEQESEQAGEPSLSGEELVRRFLEEFDAEELIGDETELKNEGEASG